MIEIVIPSSKEDLYIRATDVSHAVQLVRDHTSEKTSKYAVKQTALSWAEEVGRPSHKGCGVWKRKKGENTLRKVFEG